MPARLARRMGIRSSEIERASSGDSNGEGSSIDIMGGRVGAVGFVWWLLVYRGAKIEMSKPHRRVTPNFKSTIMMPG